jgi:hypothetical protein
MSRRGLLTVDESGLTRAARAAAQQIVDVWAARAGLPSVEVPRTAEGVAEWRRLLEEDLRARHAL